MYQRPKILTPEQIQEKINDKIAFIKESRETESIKVYDQFNVSWNQGPNEGMTTETFTDYLEAEKRSKEICMELLNERYAEREDFPTVSVPILVEYAYGGKLTTFAHLTHGRSIYL